MKTFFLRLAISIGVALYFVLCWIVGRHFNPEMYYRDDLSTYQAETMGLGLIFTTLVSAFIALFCFWAWRWYKWVTEDIKI